MAPYDPDRAASRPIPLLKRHKPTGNAQPVEKPMSNLPEEAVELYDLFDSSKPRVIDRSQESTRHCGRFAERSVVEQVIAARGLPATSTEITPVWCVIIDGIGYPIIADQEKPVMTSARAAVIAQMAPAERELLSPEIGDLGRVPWEPGRKVTTLYDLFMPSMRRELMFFGRFLDRSEAEKLSDARHGNGQFIEAECYISGNIAYKVGRDRYPVLKTARDAILEQMAPEYRRLIQEDGAAAPAEVEPSETPIGA